MKGTDSLNDEIKQERARTLEGKSLGYKFKYYVYYYKWYVIVGVAAVILICSVIRSIMSNKDSALGIAMINAVYDVDYEGFMKEYEQIAGVDNKHEMTIDAAFTISEDGEGAYDLQAQEKLFVVIATGQIDIIIAPEKVFKGLADLGYMTDLGEILPEDELKRYEDDIFIGHVADDSVEAVDNENAPRHEELSGIDISGFNKVVDEGWYAYHNCPIYLGFIAEGGNTQNAVDFFHYLQE